MLAARITLRHFSVSSSHELAETGKPLAKRK
jgi:hypothetical protein